MKFHHVRLSMCIDIPLKFSWSDPKKKEKKSKWNKSRYFFVKKQPREKKILKFFEVFFVFRFLVFHSFRVSSIVPNGITKRKKEQFETTEKQNSLLKKKERDTCGVSFFVILVHSSRLLASLYPIRAFYRTDAQLTHTHLCKYETNISFDAASQQQFSHSHFMINKNCFFISTWFDYWCRNLIFRHILHRNNCAITSSESHQNCNCVRAKRKKRS